MTTPNTARTTLAAIAAAALLTVALPAGTAMAQKTKTPPPVAAETTPAVAPDVTVEIPTIDAVDANVGEETLRSIFSGNIADNAGALAGLTASSITIPEITVSIDMADGESGSTTMTDIELTDVVEGVAGSVAINGTESTSPLDSSASFGPMTAEDVNIAAILAMYGLVDQADATEMQTLYTNFAFAGGTFTGPDIDCTIGEMTAAEFKARPLKSSMLEFMALAQEIETAGDEMPPELTGKMMRLYADLFTAFEASPMTFGGIDCSGLDDAGRDMLVQIGEIAVGAMTPGIYPEISMDDFNIEVGEDVKVSMGNLLIKAMDLSGPIALVEAAPELLDAAWFEANARALIPAFEGFAISDVSIDAIDPEDPTTRITGSLGAFDMTLLDYINGVPADVSTSAEHLVVDLDAASEDEQVSQLIALGLTSVDVGFTLASAWNEAEDTIDITEFSVTGEDLATINLTGTIANATEALFAIDPDMSLMAAMELVVRNLKLDVTDAGLSDLILASIAAEQGTEASTLRPVFAGLAEGTIVGFMAGAAEAQAVGTAVNDFISGTAKRLTIDLTAKDPVAGLGMADFMAAETDPSVLIGKVNVTATAE